MDTIERPIEAKPEYLPNEVEQNSILALQLVERGLADLEVAPGRIKATGEEVIVLLVREAGNDEQAIPIGHLHKGEYGAYEPVD